MCLRGYIFCLSLRSQGLNTPMALSLIGADSTMLSLIISESSFTKQGTFFPSFAPNIGCGENIYNLSYYGLYSPIILFSYLLPFVKMSTYIQIVSIIGIIASLWIFYIWMRQKFTDNTAFALSFVFLFSAPLYLPQSQAHNVRELYAVPAFRFYGYRGLF